jgi:L-arabinose isomerase
MSDILIDEDTLRQSIGASVIPVSGEELTRRFQATKPTKLQHPSIRDLSPDEAARSARLCEAVNSLVEEHQANGGSLNCHGRTCLKNPEIGLTACYSLGVQNALGRPFTCTGDLPTALALLILKNLTGISMYTEVQVMDEMRNALVIANSGEGEDGIRRKNCDSVVSGNANFRGLHGRGASFVYPLQAGPATIVSFTPTPRGEKPFRLIVAEGEILSDPLPDSGALAGFFRFKKQDLHAGYTAWLEAGVVHHAGTTLGHWSRELQAVAELLNIEFIEV